MMFSSVIVALAGLLVPSVIAGAIPSPLVAHDEALPHPLGSMIFTGTLGGHQVQLNGSVQEIVEQMKSTYPDFKISQLAAGAQLDTRDVANKGKLYCSPQSSWYPADAWYIEDGIKYLNGFQGLCGVPAQTCVRISCSWSAAIFICNDNKLGITPNCKYIASYATDIIQKCAQYDILGNGLVCGQEFDTDNYNVVVREDKC